VVPMNMVDYDAKNASNPPYVLDASLRWHDMTSLDYVLPTMQDTALLLF